MPIFEYRCQDCESQFELLLTRSDTEEACPGCGSEELEKLLSGFAVGATGGTGAPMMAPSMGPGACGTCGDPRGPGSCN